MGRDQRRRPAQNSTDKFQTRNSGNRPRTLTFNRWRTMALFSRQLRRAWVPQGLAVRQRAGSTQKSLKDCTFHHLATGQAPIIDVPKTIVSPDSHLKRLYHLPKMGRNPRSRNRGEKRLRSARGVSPQLKRVKSVLKRHKTQ